MDGQMTFSDYMTDMTVDKHGKLKPAPKWFSRERCEKCSYWNISPTQPADGWGIFGACTSYRNKGHEVSKTDYCSDYEDRYH